MATPRMRQTPSVQVAPSPSFQTVVAADKSVVTLVDRHTDVRHVVRLPATDIESCVRFSAWRCFVSVIGFALVLTDIPRTGLFLPLGELYKTAAPGVFFCYGPFAYSAIHINRTATNASGPWYYTGLRKGLPLAAATVWSYKFDTLSIAHRAVAQHVGVAAYPDCILYKAPCVSPALPLETAFAMVDGWVVAMQARYFPHATGAPFVFLTRSNWLDRLHHILIKPLWRRQDARLHTVRFHSAEATNATSPPWSLCSPPTPTTRERRVLRAYICDLSVRWRFKHPFPPKPPPAAPPMVSIARHIELRLLALRNQYPGLRLDVMITTTRSILSSESFQSRLPIVFYSMENVEITTWIRGCRCDASSLLCETVFVDDYRYEGATLTTNADDWRMVTGGLRAVAQGYIWLRFLLLCWGAFRARSDEPKFARRALGRRLVATAATLSRIPSHVIVYGSWLPVCCHSAAHVIDSGVTHLISNNVWASTDGLFHFQLVGYVRSASVQMRNVWMVALVWKLAMLASTVGHGKSRGDAWAPPHGVLAIRGIFVSYISWLTVFSFVRALRFRDTSVVAFHELPRHVPFNGLRFPPNYTNIADFGYRVDVKTALTATLLVSLYGQWMQRLVHAATRRQTRYFFSRSYYVPLSAGRLWPHSMLNMFWNLRLHNSAERTATSVRTHQQLASISQTVREASFQLLEKSVEPATPNPTVHCVVCNRMVSLIHWRGVQGCVRHDHLFRVETRQKEVWSMVRLVNIALLSDPAVLCGVYVFGKELYAYASADVSSLSTNVCGPLRADTVRAAFLLPAPLEDTRARGHRLKLFAVVDSRAVPWSVLVGCG